MCQLQVVVQSHLFGVAGLHRHEDTLRTFVTCSYQTQPLPKVHRLWCIVVDLVLAYRYFDLYGALRSVRFVLLLVDGDAPAMGDDQCVVRLVAGPWEESLRLGHRFVLRLLVRFVDREPLYEIENRRVAPSVFGQLCSKAARELEEQVALL